MQIEIAQHERMSESGSSLLRLIQNNDTCRLDLLVRESIQNCLDAGDKVHDSVKVEFITGHFETKQISPYFERITHSLNSKYPGKQEYISIKDTNTVGLTGPIRYSDIKDGKFGNLLKLIYEISKPQDQSGAGGSWGLGKTVYFRIGIGLVIYYSRVKKEGFFGGYESRLAAALVEDETKGNHLLPQNSNLQRGIAWWGSTDPKNRSGKHTVPVTDAREIRRILDAFGIQPFGDDETGTMIIIPFIDSKKLLDETIPSGLESETEFRTPYWCQSGIEEYLKIAFQRWYAPRINNKKYNGQYLEIYTNGSRLTKASMAPIFALIQALYNSRPGSEEEFEGKKVISKPIELRSTFVRGNSKAGFINYIKVTANDMKMLEPDNYPNPYYYINKLSSETMYNDPIIMYTRKPGMIVSYATTGDWTDSIPKAAIGEYIVGIFVANSDNSLVAANMSFEEYIRGSEKADHMAWEDWAINGKNPQIIARVKKGVRKKIKDDYVVITSGAQEKKNLGLGKMLADALLPPTGFTYWDDAQGGTTGQGGTGGTDLQGGKTHGGGTNNTSHVILRQTGRPEFNEEGVYLPVRVLFGKRKSATLYMQVETERGSISSNDWEKNINTQYPIILKGFILSSVTKGKGRQQKKLYTGNLSINKDMENDIISVSFGHSSVYQVQESIRVAVNDTDNMIVDGVLVYEAQDVQGTIQLREET